MAVITEYIQTLLDGDDLTTEQAGALLDAIFEGDVPEVQIAAFLTAMRIKGPTSAELAGLAGSLRSHAVRVKTGIGNLIDTCGTGGGRFKTSNISTASAFVAAGAGAYVAKHGNRGITSGCGSADVLAELGVKIDASADVVARCIEEAHIGFMFAPMFHPAMKYVQTIRKSLGFRTVFNILGPLANPALAPCQLMGVADEKLLEIIPEALKLMGTRHAMVVHSNGLDEINTTGVTKIVELKDGKLSASELNPKDLGIKPADVSELKVEDAKESAAVLRNILTGKETGPKKDIVILNAAAAAIVAGLADDFDSALKMAAESITSGSAQTCLEKLIIVSNG
jgi:anthranilate phosphoribosyltransferase